jgi:hypothetical protein
MGAIIEENILKGWKEPKTHEANENLTIIDFVNKETIKESKVRNLVYYNCDCVESEDNRIRFTDRFEYEGQLIEAANETHDEHDVIDYRLS